MQASVSPDPAERRVPPDRTTCSAARRPLWPHHSTNSKWQPLLPPPHRRLQPFHVGGASSQQRQGTGGHPPFSGGGGTQKWAQASRPPHRSGEGRIHGGALPGVLCRTRREARADGALLPSAEWRRRASQPVRRRDSPEHAQRPSTCWVCSGGEAITTAIYLLTGSRPRAWVVRLPTSSGIAARRPLTTFAHLAASPT